MIKFAIKGLRLTPQRVAVLEYLAGNTDHPSAEDIHTGIKKKFPMISLATVYKILEALKGKGYVQELTMDRERRHFDPEMRFHHHIICVKCKKISDIYHDYFINIPDKHINDFEVTDVHIEFFGICPACRVKGGYDMPVFKCENCGATKEGKCKPKKCPECGEDKTMKKEGA